MFVWLWGRLIFPRLRSERWERFRVEDLRERERERKRNVSWLVNQQWRERVQTLCLTIESWIFDNIEGAFEMGVACVPVCGGHMDELVCIVRALVCVSFQKDHVLISTDGQQMREILPISKSDNSILYHSALTSLHYKWEIIVDAGRRREREMRRGDMILWRRPSRNVFPKTEAPLLRDIIKSGAQKLFHQNKKVYWKSARMAVHLTHLKCDDYSEWNSRYLLIFIEASISLSQRPAGLH